MMKHSAVRTGICRASSALLCGLVVMGLGACANRTDPAIVNTASYQTGYSDGCATGNQQIAGFKKTVRRNEAQFKTDEAYRIGWSQGFSACGGQKTRREDFLSEDRFDQGPI